MAMHRNKSDRISTYPWMLDYILTHEDLSEGWEVYDEEDDSWSTFTEIERLAAKITASEKAIFCGHHSTEIMATRRHLHFELYEPSPTSDPLRRLAAETSRALADVTHGRAPARGNSLITSYRLLDILAFLIGAHEGVCRHPAEKPIGLAPTGPSTYILEKYGQHLLDIKKILVDFKASWEASRKTRDAGGKNSTNDLLLLHIKQTLTIGQLSHAQKVERNILAAALPITIMIMDNPIDASSDDPPEMLDGLDVFVQHTYLQGDGHFSTADKAKITTLFTKPNIRNMRKPHAATVHISPLLNLLDVNWQKAEVTEDDFIKTSRIIGTHDIALLDSIERVLWRAIIHISNGTSPVTAIDAIVENLPWDEIDIIMSDDEINQRFMPNCLPVDLSQYSPSRLPQLQKMQEFFNNDQSNAGPAPSVNKTAKSASEKRKAKSGKAHRIETVSTPTMLSSTVHEEMEALNTKRPFTVCTTEQDWIFYDPVGRSRQVHPSFHFLETRDWLLAVQDIIESSYHENKPRHISAPQESVVQVITAAERQSMTPRNIQQLFKRRHIIRVGSSMDGPRLPFKFDLGTLEWVLGPLYRPIVVQDESIPDDDIRRLFTLAGLYEIQDSGRAVRTMEIPIPGLGQRLISADLAPFSTDRRAYEYKKYCPEKDHTGITDRPPPFNDMEWSLVALKGATRDIRISPEGAGTLVQCLVGCEWYILLRPKGNLDHRQFGNVKLFQQNARLDDLVLNHFDVEAFLLLPDMQCFIRPGTPYCVFTVENSITHGAYFYTLSTMQDSFFGLLHAFATTTESMVQSCASSLPPFRHIIRLIVQYVYNTLIHRYDAEMPLFSHAMDPDALTIDDAQDLLSVISIGILSNALDPNTYKPHPHAALDKRLSKQLAQLRLDTYDYNALPYDDRLGCTLARGFAYELRDWFCHFYSIQGHDEPSTLVLTQKIMAHQACVLLKSKLASELYDESQEIPDAVKKQISNLFPKDSAESEFLAAHILCAEQRNASPLMYVSLDGCSISNRDNPPNFNPRSISEICALGMSPLDEKYDRGRDCAFEVHVEGAKKKSRRAQAAEGSE